MLMGQNSVENFNYTIHFHHYLILRSLQIKTLQNQKSNILSERFVQMPTKDSQQCLFGNNLSSHFLQLWHQFFAAGQQTSPNVLIFRTFALQEFIYCSVKGGDAQISRNNGFLVIDNPICLIILHDITSKFHGLASLKSKWFVRKYFYQSATPQLFFIFCEEITELMNGCIIQQRSQHHQRKFYILESDRRQVFNPLHNSDLPLFLFLFAKLVFQQAYIVLFSLQLIPKLLYDASKAGILSPQIILFLVIIGQFIFINFLILLEFLILTIENILLALQATLILFQVFNGLFQSGHFLVFLLLLFDFKLIDSLKQQILVLVIQFLYLCFFQSQFAFQSVDLLPEIVHLSALNGLARFQQIFIIFKETNGSFMLLVLLLDQFQKFILQISLWLINSSHRSNDAFKTNSLTQQILFFDTCLIKNTNMGEMFQLFDFLFSRKVQLVELLYLFLQNFSVDRLFLALILPHCLLPLLLNSFQKLNLSLILTHLKFESGGCLLFGFKLLFNGQILFHQSLIIPFFKLRVVLTNFQRLSFIEISSRMQQFLKDVITSQLHVIDIFEFFLAEQRQTYISGSLCCVKLFFESIRFIYRNQQLSIGLTQILDHSNFITSTKNAGMTLQNFISTCYISVCA